MTEDATARFNETLLSGYLDGELTQAEAQRVRLHLEDHPEARALLAEMRRIRNAQLDTGFRLPQDQEWKEIPRTSLSRASRWLGWVGLVTSGLSVLLYGLWKFTTSAEPVGEKVVVFGILGGFALLLLSVALDRWAVAKTDRYGRVEK